MPKFRGMNYSVHGEGRAIVLLHGWGASSKTFYNLIEFLSLNYKVYAIDFLGFGKSDEPNKDYTIFSYAEDINRFILDIVKEKVILLGHSFGGRVCLILGSRAYVEAIVLVDSAGIKPRFSLFKYIKIKQYKRLKQEVEKNPRLIKKLDKFGSLDYKSLSKDKRGIFVRVVNQDLSKFCSKITCPTLILWGKADKDTFVYMAKRLHRLIVNSKLEIISGGHYSFLDNEKVFNRSLYKFLESL